MVQSFIANKDMYTMRFMELFKSIDSDNSGFVTIDEFEEHINDAKVEAYFATLGLEPCDAISLFKMLESQDLAEEGIKVEDFVHGCLRLKGLAKSCDMARVMYETKTILRELQEFMAFAEKQFSEILEHSGKKVTRPHKM